jgi:hypothetical protein
VPTHAKNPRSDLALRFAASNADQLRYVTSRRRWFIRDGASWRPDQTLDVLWRARQSCLQAAAESNEPARNLAATIAAIERLARHDLRLAVATETELGIAPRRRSARR